MQRAIGSFIKAYTAIKTQLETASHDNAKAEGLAKIMGDVAVITFIIILKVQKYYVHYFVITLTFKAQLFVKVGI